MAEPRFSMRTHSWVTVSGVLLLLAGQLLLVLNVCAAQTDEVAPHEASTESADLGHHDPTSAMVEMMMPHHQHSGPHMKWTALRPPNAADAQRAEQLVQTLRPALEKYRDYRAALEDGFVPVHPERQFKHYHFANKQRRFMARTQFDAAKPTSLLYKKTGNGYELEGAMYTAPRDMTEEQLNERVPLSIAQWHAHVNLCVAPDGSGRRLNRRQFGLRGTIVTESECQQAGGRFVPQLGGWMIHVYPFETTTEKIWTH
jgi:hypothetical protein